jgi:hypothetical protein
MSTNILVALALFAVAQVCIVLAGYLQWIMIAEVNRKLPDGEHISSGTAGSMSGLSGNTGAFTPKDGSRL